MPWVIAQAIKDRIPVLIHSLGYTVAETCQILGIKKTNVYNTLGYYEHYGMSTNPHAQPFGHHHRKLTTNDVLFIWALIKQRHNPLLWWDTAPTAPKKEHSDVIAYSHSHSSEDPHHLKNSVHQGSWMERHTPCCLYQPHWQYSHQYGPGGCALTRVWRTIGHLWGSAAGLWLGLIASSDNASSVAVGTPSSLSWPLMVSLHMTSWRVQWHRRNLCASYANSSWVPFHLIFTCTQLLYRSLSPTPTPDHTVFLSLTTAAYTMLRRYASLLKMRLVRNIIYHNIYILIDIYRMQACLPTTILPQLQPHRTSIFIHQGLASTHQQHWLLGNRESMSECHTGDGSRVVSGIRLYVKFCWLFTTTLWNSMYCFMQDSGTTSNSLDSLPDFHTEELWNW